MLENYLPIAVFIIIAGVLGLLMLGLGFLFGKGAKTKAKLSPYECGFEEFEDARIPFDVRYYLVAILFIIFDLEIAFLFPWAIALDEIGHVGLISMIIFLFVLVIGFVYEWNNCLLYTSPSPRDLSTSRMPSSA